MPVAPAKQDSSMGSHESNGPVRTPGTDCSISEFHHLKLPNDGKKAGVMCGSSGAKKNERLTAEPLHHTAQLFSKHRSNMSFGQEEKGSSQRPPGLTRGEKPDL